MATLIGLKDGTAVKILECYIGDSSKVPTRVSELYIGDNNKEPELSFRDKSIIYSNEYELLEDGIQQLHLIPISNISEAKSIDGCEIIIGTDENGNMYQVTNPGIKLVNADQDMEDNYNTPNVYYGSKV